MRNSLRLAAVVLLALAPLSAQAQETSGSFTEGSIRFGYDNRTCDASLEGSLRYVSASAKVEVCDGVDWGEIASANGASTDTTPDVFTFTDLTNHSLGAIALSETLNIIGFDGPLIAEVSGSGTPQISVNGGAFVTAASINPGDTLRVRLTSSTSVSTAHVAAVTVGTVTDNWSVTTKAGQTQIFFTIPQFTGAGIGSLANADTICQTDAANRSFAGTWKAILSDETTNAKDRVTIVYPVIRATDGLTVDTANLFDGSLDTNKVNVSSVGVWTGSTADGVLSAGDTCSNWTSTAGNGREGNAAIIDSRWFNNNTFSCALAFSLYCVDQ